MSPKEQLLEKIDSLANHIDLLKRESNKSQANSMVIQLFTLDASFEQLRRDNSKVLICRYLASFVKYMTEEDQLVDLAEYENLINPYVSVWVPIDEISTVFDIPKNMIVQYMQSGRLSLFTRNNYHFCEWNEIKNLIENRP